MKSTLKALATLFVAATLTLVACKPEKIEPETPGDEKPVNIYAGTTWEAHLQNDYTYQNILMNVSYDLTLDFLDTVNGELFTDIYLYIPQMPSQSQSTNYTEPFRYTFAGDSIVMTCAWFNPDINDSSYYHYVGYYDTAACTITIDLEEPEMEEIMGTCVVTLTKVENPAKAATLRPTSSKACWKDLLKKIAQAL